jgi:nitrogenase molybdenum-iron protein NifN
MNSLKEKHSATTNACKLCTPLGASVAFKGVRGAITLMHGSQGCATYIRRYLISHYNEPIDIASSNFDEDTAIFGGNQNLQESMRNIISQYNPDLLGICTTCLSETIGDDVPMGIREFMKKNNQSDLPLIVHVSTASYRGTHIDGYYDTITSLVDSLAREGDQGAHLNIFPSFISPADLRHIKDILSDFGADSVLLPDYSETLDGESWSEYEKIPSGGTSADDIRRTGSAAGTIEIGSTCAFRKSAGKLLEERYGVPCHTTGIPIGITGSDPFFSLLESHTGTPVPEKYLRERGRLIDSYADGHKYLFGKKAIVYGEEDFAAALTLFLNEIGIKPLLCASGGRSGSLEKIINSSLEKFDDYTVVIKDDTDFNEIGKIAEEMKPDLIIGNSKGYKLAHKMGIPLVRCGFPIHDRLGGQRVLHIGYRGAQQLFDQIVNTLLEKKQNESSVGYSYM